MKTVIAVDPGKHHLGVAWFSGRQLDRAALIPTAEMKDFLETWSGYTDELVIEKPRIYPHTIRKNDIADLSAKMGEIVGVFQFTGAEVFTYTPSEWKGQLPKRVTERRVKETLEKQGLLSLVELPRRKSLAHNIYDAVALGLHHIQKKGRRK